MDTNQDRINHLLHELNGIKIDADLKLALIKSLAMAEATTSDFITRLYYLKMDQEDQANN